MCVSEHLHLTQAPIKARKGSHLQQEAGLRAVKLARVGTERGRHSQPTHKVDRALRPVRLELDPDGAVRRGEGDGIERGVQRRERGYERARRGRAGKEGYGEEQRVEGVDGQWMRGRDSRSEASQNKCLPPCAPYPLASLPLLLASLCSPTSRS